ncbi:CREB-regulated transcription coactivator 2 [Megalops cyprinoides]|uniref:CREB-regulated transcription coactivator 2 n=1 Tax=Megalops cyprinoides TaxID=118141 RepID=UPI001864A89B|nr:CREB-regulated transcription coactivator 2 [Megalops cyprinoides]
MSAAGTGAGSCGPGPGAGSGASNPRKFSEKIALHTQRQAEETAAFREVMMDITSTRIQAQKVRLARSQGPYYGGSLPNVNQIGRNVPDLQGTVHSNLDSSRSTRHHGLVERVQRDRRFMSPVRPYRRQIDSSPYSSPYLSPPPDPSWRRNWSSNFPMDKNQSFRLPTTALNRTNSDSALHTSVMNPNTVERLSTGHSLNPQSRLSGMAEGEGRKMFPYPVPPIEENILDEGKLLKPWDTKKLPMLSSRPKSCEVPGINIFPSPDQQCSTPHIPSALNTGGSLPDLSSLHFPSPLPTPLDPEEPGYPSISGGCSTGNLTNTLTQLGINTSNAFHSAGLSASLQGTLSNSFLQSSLSNPNIKSSLSSHSFNTSLSSTSLHSSLSNPSLQSSLSSSPSLHSSLSNQSLHSSLSNSSLSGQSLQSAASNPSFGSGVGGSGSCSSFSPLLGGQPQTQLSTSPRRRAQLSPLILPIGGESRRHHPKQFSPTISPTLSSITQGVPLDTSRLPMDQRLPPYPYSQPQQMQTGPPASHQPLQKGMASSPAGQAMQQPQASQQSMLHQSNHQHQQLHHQQQRMQLQPQDLQLQLQNMQNLQTMPMQHVHRPSTQMQNQTQTQAQTSLGPQGQNSQHIQQHIQEREQDSQTQSGPDQQQQNLPPLQQISHSLATDLGLYNETSLLNTLLDDPYLGLQLTARQSHSLSQQFNVESQVEGLSFNHNSENRSLPSKGHEDSYPGEQGPLDFQNSSGQQLLNNPNQNYRGGDHQNVPNIILTGDSPPGLSKEITSALSGVPGFEVDTFSLDDPLRMDPLALEGLGMLADGDLMLADPAVEDSFRSDRLK